MLWVFGVQAPQEEEAADGEVARVGELRADDPPELLAHEPQLDRARLRAKQSRPSAFGLGPTRKPGKLGERRCPRSRLGLGLRV
jgi:hypothetical protein